MLNPERFPKNVVPVRVRLTDSSEQFGVVYVRQNQRILDMMCDDRMFFPMKSERGVLLLNKAAVIKVDIMGMDDVFDKENLFPDMNVTYLKNNVW